MSYLYLTIQYPHTPVSAPCTPVLPKGPSS
ncbi:hypothetical protein PITC_068100 [Penicillium italicum]|uniref:Uncharacterized protein n=1 Tax=Penicillium italicum TaxID=40296 RepID=A0A0A2LH01_PENIT|nr:hypothetical protein PITC_068100 [Penicillium italicum]